MKTSKFLVCEKCGKRLIEQQDNGMFVFNFGKSGDNEISPVEIKIYGSIEIKCIRKNCNHLNRFNKFD